MQRLFSTSTKTRKSDSYWTLAKNQRALLDQIGKIIGITKWQDWYDVTSNTIKKHGGGSLLFRFKNSPALAIQSIYPENPWVRWKFRVSKGFWANQINQREFLTDVANELKLQDWTEWYSVRGNDVVVYGGAGLLAHFNYSLPSALKSAFPEYSWDNSKFESNSEKVAKQHRLLLDEIGKILEIKTYEDWYSITKEQFLATKGQQAQGILNYHKNNHVRIRAIMKLYPEFPWKIWKFERVTSGFWDDESNVREALDYLTKQLNIKSLDNWKAITAAVVDRLGFGTLLTKYGGLLALLQRFYPDHEWPEKQNFSKNLIGKSHTNLTNILRELFQEDILSNYPHPDLQYPGSQSHMELDVFIPRLNLAFEYQGKQHYNQHFLYHDLNERQMKDSEKRKACEQIGITLIEIPYWWDEERDSLQATIHKFRPDLIKKPKTGSPIPETKPFKDGKLEQQMKLSTPIQLEGVKD